MTAKFSKIKGFFRNIILCKVKHIFKIKNPSTKEIKMKQLIVDVKKGISDMKHGRTYTQEEMEKTFGLL